MPVRRTADPVSVQNVWDAIRVANFQKQMADSTRITKYLQKTLLCTQVQAELYLKQTLQDDLIIALQKVTTKGSNAGNEVESYRIPQQEQENESVRAGHDWYCIDCHLAGDVSLCITCHRVFHAECAHKKQILAEDAFTCRKLNSSIPEVDKLFEPLLTVKTPDQLNASTEGANFSDGTFHISVSSNGLDTDCDRVNDTSHVDTVENNINSIQNASNTNDDDPYYDEAVCSICNMCRTDKELPVQQEELNYLLTFIFNRVKSWIPIDICKVLEPDDNPPEWYTDKERKWRSEKLIYDSVILPVVEKKLSAKEYRQPYEFKADLLSIQHSIAVFHGTDTQEYKASEFLMKDSLYEISELYNCLDCYKHSNEKVNENWFCIPCRVPHKLVWAKQLGHPYWPAKVLKETDKYCDVRFFGGKYERAVLSKMYLKPISVGMSSLNIKKKPGFNKAVKELILHQKLLKNADGALIDNNQSSQENEKPEKTVKDKSLSFKRKGVYITYKGPKSKKRSHSVDKLSEKTDVAKMTKRRNSSATLNITIAKSRGGEYATRQTLQNLTNKKRKKSSASASTKDIDIPEAHSKDKSSLITKTHTEDSNVEHTNQNDESHEEVTSSSETIKLLQESCSFHDVDTKMPKPERQYSESVEKTRRKLEECLDKDDLIKIALECMQAEIDKITNEHDIYLKRVFEAHNNQISETKKKQWCYNCEQDAIYHCCWNTAYCSLICQQQHWQAEHKKVCRRKR